MHKKQNQFNPSGIKWPTKVDMQLNKTQTGISGNNQAISHIRTIHSYLLEAKQQPMCHACQTEHTVKHILTECTNLAQIRETFYWANDRKELFQNIEIKNVMSFLKVINIHSKYRKEISTRLNFSNKLFLYKKLK